MKKSKVSGILRADTALQQITITGQNFGTLKPTVWLNNVPLSVNLFTDTAVTPFLPANIAPGSYLLVLSNTKTRLFGFFVTTLGAVGPRRTRGAIPARQDSRACGACRVRRATLGRPGLRDWQTRPDRMARFSQTPDKRSMPERTVSRSLLRSSPLAFRCRVMPSRSTRPTSRC